MRAQGEQRRRGRGDGSGRARCWRALPAARRGWRGCRALTVAPAQRLEQQLPLHADGRHGGPGPRCACAALSPGPGAFPPRCPRAALRPPAAPAAPRAPRRRDTAPGRPWGCSEPVLLLGRGRPVRRAPAARRAATAVTSARAGAPRCHRRRVGGAAAVGPRIAAVPLYPSPRGDREPQRYPRPRGEW